MENRDITNIDDIKDYLFSIICLEKTCYDIKQFRDSLREKIFTPNEVEPLPKDPGAGSLLLSALGYGIVSFFVLGFVTSVVLQIPGSFIITLVGSSVVVIYKYSSTKSSYNDSVIRADQENKSIRENNRKQEYKIQVENALIAKTKNELDNLLKETEKTLDRVYSQNILYKKYHRNISAIASFYEYLSSKRCSSLEGANGAYDTYEYESRFDKIITRLDHVLSQLDVIIETQHNIYYKIKEMDNRLDETKKELIKGLETLDSIKTNTQITAYTAQTIERNQYYERRCNKINSSVPSRDAEINNILKIR